MTEYRTTVSAGGGLDFVLSDGSLDRHGTRINPDGWEVDRRNSVCMWSHGLDPAFGKVPIGQWENVRAEDGKLLGRLKLAAKGTSQRIDELISLVEQGIIRAVSVGFEVLEEGKRGSGGFDFMRQALTEASLVAVGSNKNALAQARSLNISETTIRTVFGEHADEERRNMPTGEHAAIPPSKAKKMDLPIAKRIENAQTELNAARDAYQVHIKNEDYDLGQAETFKAEVDNRTARLDSLKDAERTLMLRAAEGESRDLVGAKPERRPLGIRSKDIEPRDLLVRAASVHLLSHLMRVPYETVLEQRYPDHKQTHEYVRAAVTAATTTVAGWASELVQTVTDAFLMNLDPNAVLPRLAAAGTQLSFGPGRGIIKIPSRATTPSITGSFVAEGSPIPVRKLGLTSIELKPHKVGVISTFTREIMRYSQPQIEGIVRDAIIDDTSITLDTLLLDATAESATRPAGIIFGVSAKTASVLGGYKAILADLTLLSAPFFAANAGRRMVLIMNPAQGMALSMAPGPDGTFGWSSQFTSRFTVIESTTVPAGNLYMLDAADFVSVTSSPEFELSDQVTLHMEDSTPLPISSTGTPNVVAAPVISTFQEAKIALRMLMDTTWAMRRTGMVQYMTGVSWAPI
jgi:HK97 family phage major capsid protein